MKIWKYSASGLLRGVSAAAVAAAMLGLGSGTASALVMDFLVDFDTDPPVGVSNSSTFTNMGFTFTFEASGDGGSFAQIQTNLGEDFGAGKTDGMDASSNFVFGGGLVETVTIVRTDAGDFSFGSIHINNAQGLDLTVEGLLGGGTTFGPSIVGAGVTMTVPGGLTLVDTLVLSSTDIFIIFDTFAGELPMDMQPVPEPGTLALFVTGLIGLGLLSRRRRRSA